MKYLFTTQTNIKILVHFYYYDFNYYRIIVFSDETTWAQKWRGTEFCFFDNDCFEYYIPSLLNIVEIETENYEETYLMMVNIKDKIVYNKLI
jgi:hypothetical protein